MSLLALTAAVVAFLVLGYSVYGGWVARQLALDSARPTPAQRLADGIDFVPTRT